MIQFGLCPRCESPLTEEQLQGVPEKRGKLLTMKTTCDGCGMNGRIQMPLDEYRRRKNDHAERVLDRRAQGRLVAHFRNTLNSIETVGDIVEWA